MNFHETLLLIRNLLRKVDSRENMKECLELSGWGGMIAVFWHVHLQDIGPLPLS
jgi:hypothetical protein